MIRRAVRAVLDWLGFVRPAPPAAGPRLEDVGLLTGHPRVPLHGCGWCAGPPLSNCPGWCPNPNRRWPR